MGNDALLAYLGNMQIEDRVDADVTGDGVADVIYVARNTHERVLGVIAGGVPTAQLGRRALGEGSLDPSPEVPAVLGFERSVLSVEDLTGIEGADTVTLSRFQYRYEPRENRMRLFALVCEQYSPTLSHGSRRVSWNLDTGEHLVEAGQVVMLDTGEKVYVYESENRSFRKPETMYLDDAPRPSDLLVAEFATEKKVADGVNSAANSP